MNYLSNIFENGNCPIVGLRNPYDFIPDLIGNDLYKALRQAIIQVDQKHSHFVDWYVFGIMLKGFFSKYVFYWTLISDWNYIHKSLEIV